jgi:hypothetical protein
MTAAKTASFDMVSPYNPAAKYLSIIMPANLVDQSRISTELSDDMLLGDKNQ